MIAIYVMKGYFSQKVLIHIHFHVNVELIRENWNT